jgi:sugar lactone lactonase YvrE
MQAQLIADVKNGVGESPVWVAAEQALYWVDIPGKTLYRWSESAGCRSWLCSQMIGCIAMHAHGGWIAGLESGVYRLWPQEDGQLKEEKLAEASHPASDMRFNDGRCDRQGRLLAGTMVAVAGGPMNQGHLLGYSGGSQFTDLLQGFQTPNGLAFSPDGCTMYMSDSHLKSQLIWAFDYDTASGTPSNRRVFVDMNPLPGRPDGAAVDEDGCYWICANDAGLIHRFTPQGKLDQSLAVPVKRPAMCSFGGADMKTLFVTSIRPANVDLSDQPLAGGLFAIHTHSRGISEPVFSPTELF